MSVLASSTQPLLAARAYPERDGEAESRLDRWTLGKLLSVSAPAVLREHWRRTFMRRVDAAAADLAGLDDAALRRAARTAARRAYAVQAAVDGARALALVREAARRTLGLTPYPPQVYGAWQMLRGRLIELDTGEGKTLTAALAACVAALAGAPTHVVTVNDYLARRDAEEMGPLYAWFGLGVGVVHTGVAQAARAAEYARDITYCTNKDLVFDYLRDRVNGRGVRSLAQQSVRRLHDGSAGSEPARLRGLFFAIVDEADSILIDEARTPLILSSMREAGEGEQAFSELLAVAERLQPTEHFTLIGPQQIPELTKAGRRWLEAPPEDLVLEHCGEFWPVDWMREHYVQQALRALHVMRRDQHYVVVDGKVVIVDEFTGRLLPDRTWEQGLHQLVEAREGCAISGQNRTLARLTYQNFFARYLRLAGMSGTLKEVASELAAVYHARTVRIEPHRPCLRVTSDNLLLADKAAKQAAVADDVRLRLQQGQAVLVGTRSVRASLEISAALTAAGIRHRVLNALQNDEEAELVAQAGQPGAVTVATNMAGRGTDIKPHPAVLASGGLHVVLTEWHESARIDRQLFGRCARQGDPGTCRAIVALDDEVIQSHAAGAARWLSSRFALAGMPAWAVRLLRLIVQASAEAGNASQRRLTMQHDRQMRRQLAFSGIAE